MAISLPSEDSAQFFIGRDFELDAVKEELKVMTSLLAKVLVCHSVTIESELTEIMALLEKNIAATDFPTIDGLTRDDGRNSKRWLSLRYHSETNTQPAFLL